MLYTHSVEAREEERGRGGGGTFSFFSFFLLFPYNRNFLFFRSLAPAPSFSTFLQQPHQTNPFWLLANQSYVHTQREREREREKEIVGQKPGE
jgi:hypothetical protein